MVEAYSCTVIKYRFEVLVLHLSMSIFLYVTTLFFSCFIFQRHIYLTIMVTKHILMLCTKCMIVLENITHGCTLNYPTVN